MLELSKYIYKNYPNLKDKVPYWQLLSLLDRNEDKIIIVKENNKFKGVGLYFRLNDEILWKIKFGFLDESNPENMREIMNSKEGNNIHFIQILADGYKTIRKGLKEVINKENPKTVSWFNPEMTKFNEFNLKGKVELCQSQL